MASYPGVAKFGIALEWGSRGLEFESQHSDQVMIIRTTLSKWVMCSDLSFLLKMCSNGQGRVDIPALVFLFFYDMMDKIDKSEVGRVADMKLKTARTVMWGLLATLCVSILLLTWTRFAPFGYAAIAIIIAYGIINIAFWRCPNCGKCIGGIWLGKYNHCRYCGEEIKI